MQVKNTFTNLNQNDIYSQQYIVNNLLMTINTVFPAKITAISGLRATIQTIINTLAINQPSPPPIVIEDVPIAQLTGGNAGIIIEYKVGDVVLCGAIQRDISSIKNNWQQANPASARKFSVSDAIILFHLSNSLPTVYVKINNNGIEITAPNKSVAVNASNVTVTADNTVVNGNVALGGSGGALVLTENTIITAPNGTCTISNPATKVKAT